MEERGEEDSEGRNSTRRERDIEGMEEGEGRYIFKESVTSNPHIQFLVDVRWMVEWKIRS